MAEKNFNLLKVIKTIIRWPKLFIVPLLLVLITLVCYTASRIRYSSSAIILFESSYIPVEEYFTLIDKFDDRPVNIVRSLLFGQPASTIVESVWPEAKDNEILKNSLIQHLRSLSGISLKFQRDNPQALSVSYESENPELSYKVVKATIDALVVYNEELTKHKVNSAIEFIEKELNKTRNHIAELEQKIVRVRSGLPESMLKEHDIETQNIEKILDLNKVDLDIENSLAKSLVFSESLSDVRAELAIAKKELEQLQIELKNKTYLENIDDLELVFSGVRDPEIDKISSTLLDKQQKLNELQSKGYLGAHPEIVILTREIEKLKTMKRIRFINLQKGSNRETPELTHMKLEKLHMKKIQDKTLLIQQLEDRVLATKAYEDKFKDRTITLDDKLKEVSERKARLSELENDRLVAAHSQAQMAKRLEVIKREGRVDQKKFGLSVNVAEYPKIPNTKIPFSGFPIILLGLAVTATVLFSIAALMSYFDSAIYTAADVMELTQLPIIGIVNSFKSVEQQKQERMENVYAIVFVLIYLIVNYFLFYKI